MVMAKPEENDRPILAAEDVHLITVYGRIYCLQFDRIAMILNLYRFYRDAVVQQGSLPACSNRIAVSVVDNILLVHQVEAKVVIIYDIYADSQAPISAPLPLFLRGFPKSNAASSQTIGKTAGASESRNLTDTEITIYGDQWNFIVPDLAISASSSEVPLILEFLQRRKLEADKFCPSTKVTIFVLLIVIGLEGHLGNIEIATQDQFCINLNRDQNCAYIYDFVDNRSDSGAKHLCLEIVRTVILERRPVAMVSSAIDVLLTAYAHAIKSGSYYKRTITDETSPIVGSNLSMPSVAVNEFTTRIEDRRSIKQETENRNVNEPCNISNPLNADSDGSLKLRSHNLDPPTDEPRNDQLDSNASGRQQSEVTSSAATSPEDFQLSVFSLVEEEIAGDGYYLTAIVVEFLRSFLPPSASSEKIKVHPNTYVLMVQILARDEQYAVLGLFIMKKLDHGGGCSVIIPNSNKERLMSRSYFKMQIIEPSKEVALQLLESGRQNIEIRKLGLGMLSQLSLHHDYVLLLVQDGYYLEALRYARKKKVNTVRPSLFLEAAYSSKDPQHVAAVLRFFCDFIPGFKTTSDHQTYYRLCAEMSS
ncbi:hypothetical protein OROGR_016788 [Orobanche gracilis]